MFRILLWLILLALVIRALNRLAQGILEGAGYRRVDGSPQAVKLVRDPVCGVFVVPSQALQLSDGTTVRYFCSEKCRRAWNGP